MHSVPPDDLQYISKNLKELSSQLRNKTILIAGATGFFGCWLIEALNFMNLTESLNLKIILISRNIEQAQKKYEHVKTSIKYVKCDLSNENDRIPAEFPADLLIHAGNDAAWPQNPSEEINLFKCIVHGTQKLLEYAAKVKAKRFLYVSSGAATMPLELKNTATRSYAESKRMAEVLTQMYAAQYGFTATIARCYSFLGPHLPLNKHYAIGNFLNHALQAKVIEIQSSGASVRSYLYASDLVIQLMRILIMGKSEAIYEVGSAEKVSIKQLAEKILEHFPSAKLSILNKNNDQSIYVPTSDNTTSGLDFPDPIPLDIALKKTILWYKQ